MGAYVSRAGLKLAHALDHFGVAPTDGVAADLGCNAGGFVDCLLQRGAARVYAVDTGYGVLEWKLRRDARVVVMERTNALHVRLPEAVDLVTIDVAWTRQRHILPAALRLLKEAGRVITLIKPHYEASSPLLRGGVLPREHLSRVLQEVRGVVDQCGFDMLDQTPSPILGSKGNVEYLALLKPRGRNPGNP